VSAILAGIALADGHRDGHGVFSARHVVGLPIREVPLSSPEMKL
jgi:hypothetical protein